MKIGDEVYIHGYIDEIRNDVIIIKNQGGYFGTIKSEEYLTAEESVIVSEIYNAPTIEPKQYYNKGYADAVQDIADVMIRQGKHIASDEPKQGEWKVVYDSKDSDLPMRMCSECGQKIPITARLNYCFECGTRMRKGESDDVYTLRNEDEN